MQREQLMLRYNKKVSYSEIPGKSVNMFVWEISLFHVMSLHFMTGLHQA